MADPASVDDVVICECFARDGLQHETLFVPTPDKVAFIDACTEAGFRRIEATSYSRPDSVPAFRDGSEVLAQIRRRPEVRYKATCPNERAVARALADLEAGQGANELSLLVSATEGHTERNLRTTRQGQWDRVARMAQAASGRFRLVGVISVALGCPIEGRVDVGTVLADVARFVEMGVRILALGDTAGLATPPQVRTLFRRVLDEVPDAIPVAHFHNTRGTGVANCLAALDAGCRWFDTSVGGVGGHPAQIRYGEGNTGNVATEDWVNLLEALGMRTGLDLDRLASISRRAETLLGRELHSQVARAGYGLLPGREGRSWDTAA